MSEDFWPRPEITFPQYCAKAVRYMIGHPEQRLGQSYFNVLHMVRQDLADAVCGTVRDPFYWDNDDDRIEVFLDWLSEEWDK